MGQRHHRQNSPERSPAGTGTAPAVQKGLFLTAKPQCLGAKLPGFSTFYRRNSYKDSRHPQFCHLFPLLLFSPPPYGARKSTQGPARSQSHGAHGYSSSRSCFLYLRSTFAYLKSKTRAPNPVRVQQTTEEPNKVIFFLNTSSPLRKSPASPGVAEARCARRGTSLTADGSTGSCAGD